MSTSVFVSAILLSIAEVTNHQATTYQVVRPTGPDGFPGSFETALLTFFRHLDVLRAVMFSEDVSLGDEWWHAFEFRQLAADDGRNHDDANWAELILEFAERWARLRFRG
ncbi:hypothetical protein N7516_010579 [Penicillium verrucosum]|uniref:uncharacterized protein n=1 Tax=Penicillium verrucosum TaxID=60171 RepID=UPI00254504D9|nr:uncharacterized protein N7516_010579 [Penicillium verrucosum]KAJ5922876.1 hypothetical protein N7516_010579 [Penicillium verrucosum]